MLGRKPRRIRSQNAPTGANVYNENKNGGTDRSIQEQIDEVIEFQDRVREDYRNQSNYNHSSRHLNERQNNSSNYVDMELSSYDDDSRYNRGMVNYQPNSQQSLESTLSHISSGLVGIFGMNSDEVVNNVLYHNNFGRVILCPNYTSPITDIYNIIASGCLNFVREEYNRIWYNFRYRGSVEFSVRAVHQKLAEVYESPNSEYNDYYEDGLSSLNNMSRDRGSILKNIFELIPSALELGTNVKLIFIISLEMGVINYKLLNQLSKLNSENVIFIIHSFEPAEVAGSMVEASVYGSYPAHMVMTKFFGMNRIFEFN